MVPHVLALPYIPTAIEFLERELLDIVERTLDRRLPVKEGNAVLLVMYDSTTPQEQDGAIEVCAHAALRHGAIDVFVADTPDRIAQVWSVRGGILDGMKADSVMQEECDVVVPRSAIAEYVKAAKRMLRGPEMSDEEWEQATTSCLKELYALSKRLGGQLSGEHGIGNGRLEYFKEFVGPRMIELHKAVKLAFDPNLILNPGKVVEFE